MGLNYGAFVAMMGTNLVGACRAEADRKGSDCAALMLGRQRISLSPAQKDFSAARYGVAREALNGYAETLLTTLGCTSVESLDYSDFEGAERIWNLNVPLPDAASGDQAASLRDRYHLILDYGTSEHVFVSAESFANSLAMLKVGGRLNVMVPVCGYLDHGFYQFSPTLFYSMDGEFVKLEALMFYVNQQNSNDTRMWDGLAEDFRAHRHGLFDGSYRANLMQYLLEPVVSWAVFRKTRELDRTAFLRDTHQQIYQQKWKDRQAHESRQRVIRYLNDVVDAKLPHFLKRPIYLSVLRRTRLRPDRIQAISQP